MCTHASMPARGVSGCERAPALPGDGSAPCRAVQTLTGVSASDYQPCTESGSADYAYVAKILEHIDATATMDPAKVYFGGFSQGAMMTG